MAALVAVILLALVYVAAEHYFDPRHSLNEALSAMDPYAASSH